MSFSFKKFLIIPVLSLSACSAADNTFPKNLSYASVIALLTKTKPSNTEIKRYKKNDTTNKETTPKNITKIRKAERATKYLKQNPSNN
jgi:hypothetical protein